MNKFTINKLPYDLSSLAGLAFVGIYLKRINLNALFYQAFSVCSGVANSMLLKSYLALLCLGKPGLNQPQFWQSQLNAAQNHVKRLAGSTGDADSALVNPMSLKIPLISWSFEFKMTCSHFKSRIQIICIETGYLIYATHFIIK